MHFDNTPYPANRQRYICRGCDYAVPASTDRCPMCGYVTFQTVWPSCEESCPTNVDVCPFCGNRTASMEPEWQRARAIIRWYPRPPGATARFPVNRLLLAYWQAVKQAKELALSGYSERRIAAIQGMSKTAIHNRLLLPFRVLHSEIKRITAWLTPTPPVVRISIGIDHPPTPTSTRPTVRTIRTRYGPLTYPHDTARWPLKGLSL